DRRAMLQARMRMMQSPGAMSSLEDDNRWLDSAPIISDRCVLLSPQDSDELHCLDLIDGTVLWKQPRGEGLYVAAVYDGQVVVVDRMRVRALDLRDGRPVWQEATPIPVPSGRGFR